MRRLLGLAERWFRWVALMALTLGLLLALRSQWPAIVALDWGRSWQLMLLGGVAFAVAPLVQATSFWMILRLLRVRSPFGETMAIWAHSYLLRLAPSGALSVLYRVRERERMRATRDEVLLATVYEHLGSLAAGAVACSLGFLLASTRPPWIALGVAAPTLAATVALRPRFAGRWAQRLVERWGIDLPVILRGRELAAAVAVNAAAWAATGLAVYVLVAGLTEGDSPDPAWLTGAYAVGYLVGFVVPILPGGLGAREATLVGVLASYFGAGVATALTLAVRLANTLGELIAVGVIAAAYFGRRFRRLSGATGLRHRA